MLERKIYISEEVGLLLTLIDHHANKTSQYDWKIIIIRVTKTTVLEVVIFILQQCN